jgi:hypothetical protein
MISFSNTTYDKPSVAEWMWNFGDINSGADNYSELVNPAHFYSEPGERTVLLTATTFDGCVATFVRDTLFIDNPAADFSWITNCFVDSSATEFVNHTYGLGTTLESFKWTIQDQENNMLLEEETNSVDDTIRYIFASEGIYTITLEARNSGGCTGILSREIELEPTIRLTSDGYLEDFNASKGGWSIRSEDLAQSWTWNTPDFIGHNQPEGDKSWYTSLPADTPGYLEKSWMQSPCFDFSKMIRPLIQLDLMRSFVPNLDGAVLQYNDIQDQGWTTIGEGSQGIDWYNHYSIYNQPGGSSLGWGLDIFEPDQDWVRATHGLDELTGKEHVKFRIAIASSSRQSIGNQGFAFDNVRIAERTKLLVLEHFTNASDPDSKAADDVVDGLEGQMRRNLIDLQYHTSFPGIDPINQINPNPASTRSGANGVYDVPFAVLDGSTDPDYRYDFSTGPEIPGREDMDLQTLEIPKFKVDLEVDWFEDRVDISATVTCAVDQYLSDLQLYIAIMETSVTAFTGANGDTEFKNVVLKMLPYPSGQLLKGSWYLGRSETREQSWEYEEGFVEDVDELAVVAFVDDRSPGGEILQAAVDYKDKTVGIGNPVREARSLNLYPNPAKDNFYLNLGTRSANRGRIELLDMSGRPVISEHVPAGYQIYEVDIQHLNRGIYIVHWIEYGRVTGISKLVKTE